MSIYQIGPITGPDVTHLHQQAKPKFAISMAPMKVEPAKSDVTVICDASNNTDNELFDSNVTSSMYTWNVDEIGDAIADAELAKGYDNNIRKILIPMIRRIIPDLIATEMIGVQPMSDPAGLIFVNAIDPHDPPEYDPRADLSAALDAIIKSEESIAPGQVTILPNPTFWKPANGFEKISDTVHGVSKGDGYKYWKPTGSIMTLKIHDDGTADEKIAAYEKAFEANDEEHWKVLDGKGDVAELYEDILIPYKNIRAGKSNVKLEDVKHLLTPQTDGKLATPSAEVESSSKPNVSFADTLDELMEQIEHLKNELAKEFDMKRAKKFWTPSAPSAIEVDDRLIRKTFEAQRPMRRPQRTYLHGKTHYIS